MDIGAAPALHPHQTELCIVGDMPTPPSNRIPIAAHFETLSAVMDGKAELRGVIETALERRKLYGAKTILFWGGGGQAVQPEIC